MRQIICWGGGFDASNPLMDLYLIAQTNKKAPKVCFLPTASNDSEFAIDMFMKLFERYPCSPTYLTLSNPHTYDVEDFILEQDLIVVGGGHTKSMLDIWASCGFDNVLRKAYNNGVILSGSSAGSVCWFDECITDSFDELSVMSCLGILPYSTCPHYRSNERREKYVESVYSGAIKSGYANDDGAALHFVDEKLLRSVSMYEKHKTFHVSLKDNVFAHKELDTFDLGLEQYQQDLILSTPAFAELETQNDS